MSRAVSLRESLPTWAPRGWAAMYYVTDPDPAAERGDEAEAEEVERREKDHDGNPAVEIGLCFFLDY